MKTVNVCPGIGDNIWLLQKLINTGEKFNFRLSDKFPQRGKQIFDLLPQVTASCNYVPNLPYSLLKRARQPKKWKEVNVDYLNLQCNTHLEAGIRIEKYIEDLPTSYILPYVTNSTYKLPDGKKYIGIYGSSYSTSRHWGFWQHQKWFELIQLLGNDYTYVIIGAEWDQDLATGLTGLMQGYDYINTVGLLLNDVCEILKQLDMFIGFPSGLSILNETIGAKQTIMFYPQHLSLMINSWADPERIKSGRYKGCLFCEPKQIYGWIKENINI